MLRTAGARILRFMMGMVVVWQQILHRSICIRMSSLQDYHVSWSVYIFLLLFSVSVSCYDVPLLYLVSLMADLFAKFSLLMNTKFLYGHTFFLVKCTMGS